MPLVRKEPLATAAAILSISYTFSARLRSFSTVKSVSIRRFRSPASVMIKCVGYLSSDKTWEWSNLGALSFYSDLFWDDLKKTDGSP